METLPANHILLFMTETAQVRIDKQNTLKIQIEDTISLCLNKEQDLIQECNTKVYSRQNKIYLLVFNLKPDSQK